MKVDSLKELEKLIKLCRKTGINAITVDGITLELGYEPLKMNIKSKSPTLKEPYGEIGEHTQIVDNIETDELTGDALLYYSAVPHDTGNE